MKILSIETSCDETSAAIIKDGNEILSNLVASQVEFHKKYGGVVPEISSRKHVEVLHPLVEEALDKAKVKFKDLDAIAVTYGPGLVGSLLVGLCAAKGYAYSLGIPLIGVNHIEGHIYANFLKPETRDPRLETKKQSHESGVRSRESITFPFLCLVVSGGHTTIVLVKDHGKYETLGKTRDDAAGEAFDKVARFLGLGFPGGPIIDKIAKEGDPHAVEFPRAMLGEGYGYDFSFSGIKTAVVYYVKRYTVARLETSDAGRKTIPVAQPQPLDDKQIRDIAASFQKAVVDTLVEKTIKAAADKKVKTIALAGGVAANSLLRNELKRKAKKHGISVIIPPKEFCTDNAAMIGCVGYYRLKRGEKSNLGLIPVSTLKI